MRAFPRLRKTNATCLRYTLKIECSSVAVYDTCFQKISLTYMGKKTFSFFCGLNEGHGKNEIFNGSPFKMIFSHILI